MLSLTIGGLGLFLLGMSLMTEGLKLSGGKTLNAVLQRWTSTRLRSFTTGFAATALVQSSSAVTVSVIGFVNAGMLNLAQSMWVLFGSNVGTTMTAWIVALIGLKVKIDIVALPAIGFGAMAHLFCRSMRWRALGGAVSGLGLVFFGLSLMQSAFTGIADQIDLAWLSESGFFGFFGLLGLVLVGAVLTALMQSSSASLAVVLTAVSTGLLSLEAGAAAVVGANLGTTVTAILAVLNATSTAKRVAAAHVIFNILAGGLALLFLTPMLVIVSAIQNSLHLAPNPAVSLAIFHTLFNLTGALIMIPMTRRVTEFLETQFVSKIDILSTPQFLDAATVSSPDSAVRALMLEENRLLALVREMLLSEDRGEVLIQRIGLLGSLISQINEYISKAAANRVPQELIEIFQEVISINLHTSEVLENRAELELLEGRDLPDQVDSALTHCLPYLRRLLEIDMQSIDASDRVDLILLDFQQEYESLSGLLKTQVGAGIINMQQLQAVTRYLATFRRVVRQYGKSLKYFVDIQQPESGAAVQN